MHKKTSYDKLLSYAKRRKTDPTIGEIVKTTGVNQNTMRRVLGELFGMDSKYYGKVNHRKCKVTGNRARTYDVAYIKDVLEPVF